MVVAMISACSWKSFISHAVFIGNMVSSCGIWSCVCPFLAGRRAMHVFSRLPGLHKQFLLTGAIVLLVGASSLRAQEQKADPKQPEAQLPVGNLDTKDWL